jgi:WD40 repeat protein
MALFGSGMQLLALGRTWLGSRSRPRGASKSLDWLTSQELWSCAFSRDGSRVVIAVGAMVYVWNHVTNTRECELQGHSQYVNSVAFSNDGSHVVSGSHDKTVRIWNCHTKSQVNLYPHSHMVSCPPCPRSTSPHAWTSQRWRTTHWECGSRKRCMLFMTFSRRTGVYVM